MNTTKILLFRTKLDMVYHKAQYLVHSFSYYTLKVSSSSSGVEPSLIGSFGLLNDRLPLCSMLGTGYPIWIFIWPRSCMMLSSHLYLGLPLGLVVKGFHLSIFLAALVSGILCIWPNQLSLWALMWLTTFSCFISLSSSSLFLILHIWFSFVGPNIPLTIFLSKTSSSWIIFSCSTHVSDA